VPQTACHIPRGHEEGACAHKLGDRPLPRKTSVELTAKATVPQTDTGKIKGDSEF